MHCCSFLKSVILFPQGLLKSIVPLSESVDKEFVELPQLHEQSDQFQLHESLDSQKSLGSIENVLGFAHIERRYSERYI